ncbi:MAG TPA: 1,4-dihydroxy-6-naphthoate synthase [Mycobacteriales bacterium]|nr:1,4-dihydroxy-6-naphthoate synthase [Mycobacteriales bacterium]
MKVAFSPCPNDTFVFHAWVAGRVEGAPPIDVTYADIDVLNGIAERGEADVTKVSYGALPWLLEHNRLLASGSALGRGCGPLVLTRPGTRLDLATATVAVPGLRTTAYLLFRLWAATRGGVGRIEILPFDRIMPAVRDGAVDAGLVIHESRFTYPSFGLESVQDLGDWWEDDTGLAIPLGAIVAKRTLDTDAIARTIRASVEAAWADPDNPSLAAYIAEHAQEMDPDVQRQHIELYVNAFSADLGADGRAAVAGLLTRAADAGLVPAVDPALLA